MMIRPSGKTQLAASPTCVQGGVAMEVQVSVTGS
jgi:hypothetical protein